MRRILSAALWLAMTAPATADPQSQAPALEPRPDLPVEDVVTNPQWTKLPDADELAEYYPMLPRLLGLPGKARIGCEVTEAGTLSNCVAMSEIPAGFGFAYAALQMSAHFQMTPRTVDGKPVGGARVFIPIRFNPPQSPASAPATAPEGPEPSAETLALARRLAAATLDDAGSGIVKASLVGARNDVASNGLTPEARLAFDALDQAFTATAPARIERRAQSLARTTSVTDLKAMVAFMESPAGQHWTARSVEMRRTELQNMAELLEAVETDARQRLCRQIACADAPAKATSKTSP